MSAYVSSKNRWICMLCMSRGGMCVTCSCCVCGRLEICRVLLLSGCCCCWGEDDWEDGGIITCWVGICKTRGEKDGVITNKNPIREKIQDKHIWHTFTVTFRLLPENPVSFHSKYFRYLLCLLSKVTCTYLLDNIAAWITPFTHWEYRATRHWCVNI